MSSSSSVVAAVGLQPAPLGGLPSTSSSPVVAATGLRSAPPGGPPSTSSSTTVVAAIGNTNSTPRGPTINVFFSFGGGRCRKYQQHPQGAGHRRLLHLRWWLLPDFDQHPPGGPQSMSSTSVVVTVRNTDSTPRGPPSTSSLASLVAAAKNIDSTPQGARHRRLVQLSWWPLPEIPIALPRGPAIDVFFNFGGGHYRKYRQHPQGPRHRCLLQLWRWLLLDIPTAHLRGSTIDISLNLIPATSVSLATPTRGPLR
jgi:hypothetical protein